MEEEKKKGRSAKNKWMDGHLPSWLFLLGEKEDQLSYCLLSYAEEEEGRG